MVKSWSAKTVVIIAAFCFVGLVIMQIAWMLWAYEGELALYNKAKKQFEAEFLSELKQNEQVKEGLRKFLDHYNKEKTLGKEQEAWFHFEFVQVIDFSPIKPRFGVYMDGVSIVQHHHKGPAQSNRNIVITNIFKIPDSSQLENIGRLCVPCILGLKEELHDKYNYEILLFYKDPLPAFVENLGFLIFGSLLLLLLFGYLFREIIRKYKQEKKLSEAKNDFINNMSHEMQTPVFAIQMANRLIRENSVDTEIEPYTRIIETEAGHLKEHASKILDLASLEQGQVEMEKKTTELNTFIQQKLPTIDLMLKAKEGKLNVNLLPSPLYINVDQVHLNNVLISLCDNAIKYNNGIPIINIETREIDNKVQLTIEDTGIGIKQEYLPYITDKFFRVPDIKRTGIVGFGLGLSYVKHIIEAHGGKLKIASEEGKGTKIMIILTKTTVDA